MHRDKPHKPTVCARGTFSGSQLNTCRHLSSPVDRMKGYTGSLIALLLLMAMPLSASCAGTYGQDPSVDGLAGCASILDNANSIIFTWDNQTRLTYMNPFGLKFFGFSKDELMGRSIIGKFVPATSTSGRDLAAMIKDIARHPGQYVSNENENVKKSGERVMVLWSNSAVYDGKGNVVEIISVGNVEKGYI